MTVPWKKLSEKIEKVGWRTIFHRVFLHPTGKEVECTIAEQGEGVVIFALTGEGKVILCKHFRPGPGKILYEPAAGKVEDGESLIEAAQRELLEETGYSGDFEYVGSHYPWAWGGWRTNVFVAKDCEKVSEQSLDEFEVIDVKTMTVDAFLGLLRAGRNNQTAASYMALDHLGLLPPPVHPSRRVAVCLLRDRDKFLLQHRTDDAPRDAGRWGFFGGHIDDEEVPPDAEKTPLAAIKREIKEELDYDLVDPELIFVFRNNEVEINVFMEQYDPTKKLTLLEGKGMGWFTFEEVEKLDMVGVDRQMFVDQLREVWEKGDGM